jgi:hypothetical protein
MRLMNGRLVIAIGVSVLVACGSSTSQPPRSEGHAHGETASMGGGMCPAEVPGTTVSASDTRDGAAITFTTTGDVAQLRQRVQHMAEMHEHMMQGSGDMGSGHMHMMMVASTARVEDVEGGARIVLTPNDPAKLDELRMHVHEHTTQMANGHCPMMEHRG